MQYFKMCSVSAVIVLVLLSLLTYGACESLSSNETEGVCRVTDATAICGEEFSWPDDVKVTKIVVRSTQLTRIGKNDLNKYENLVTLDVSNSGLTQIDDDAFTANEKLEELNLSGNKELFFPINSSLISSKSITHLNISHIPIEQVPENVFTALPNLQVLDLTATSIQTYSSLSTLEHLTTLFITEDSNLDKSSICHETHLHEIIEVDNDKRTTFNCSDEPVTTILPIVPETIENGTQIHGEIENTTTTEPETTTEILEPEVNTNTSAPETHEETKNVSAETSESSAPKFAPGEIVESPAPKDDSPEIIKSAVPIVENSEITTVSATSKEPTDEIPTETEDTKSGTENTATEQEDGSLDRMIRLDITTKTNEQNETRKTHEDIVAQGEDSADVEAVMPQPSPNESSGVNIVLGIIICVMVVGVVAFGYKYYKKRRSGYRNANTEDVEDGKELQNMVTHRDRTTSEPVE